MNYLLHFQVAYIKSRTRQSNINFQKQVQRGRWDDQRENEVYGFVVEAYYIPSENKVYLPSFILDGWIFSPQRPNILNIPPMCYLLAHEIFHAFDSDGHNYNQEGMYFKEVTVFGFPHFTPTLNFSDFTPLLFYTKFSPGTAFIITFYPHF